MPPQDNQVPLFMEVAMADNVLEVPPPITDGVIREAFLTLAQAMTSQDNALTSQV